MEGAHAETAAKTKKGQTMWPGRSGEFLRHFAEDSTAFKFLSQHHVPKRPHTSVVKAAMKKTEEAATRTHKVDEVS